MKLASYRANGKESFGLIVGNGVVDLRSRLDGVADLKSLLGRGIDDLAGYSVLTADHALEDIEFLPVIPNPGMIMCMGLNTHSHLQEFRERRGLPDAPPPPKPWLFMRSPRSVTGHGQALEKPNASPLFDYEGEIALIIGKFGRHIRREEALGHVAGYSCFNEGSIRDFQIHSPLYTAGKNFPRSGSFGPWLVTADEVGSPGALSVTTRLNGEVVQMMPYDDLIYGFEEMIEYISSFTELHPGDVIVTGTGAGVGAMRDPKLWMKAGDICEIEVAGVGTLRNHVEEAQGVHRGPLTRIDAAAVYEEAIALRDG